MTVPYGYCHCGCGGKAPLATTNDSRYGAVKGKPRRYISGHRNAVRHLPQPYTVDDNGCWIWKGRKDSVGYGRVTDDSGFRTRAHRWMYERKVGPIPEGLVLDHTCRNKMCCNPGHLEPVTHAENIRRGKGARLTWQGARHIRRLASEGVTKAEIARQYGMSLRVVGQVIAGNAWDESTRRAA